MKFVSGDSAGATVEFIGTTRKTSAMTQGKSVLRLEYEVYGEMAARVLRRIAEEVCAAHDIEKIALVHRSGSVPVGGISLIAAVSAAHRAAAFDACRDAVERIKRSLPVWKKEVYADGARWIGETGEGA